MGINFVRLLPYDYGQHINVLKHFDFVHVYYECRKQFGVAVNFKQDVMTSF